MASAPSAGRVRQRVSWSSEVPQGRGGGEARRPPATGDPRRPAHRPRPSRGRAARWPMSMGARRWILADVCGAVVAWWKMPPTLEAPTAVPELVEVRAGPTAPMTAHTATPTATPRCPPGSRCPTVSPTIWRTTRPRDQPMARSVPISRTRLATLDKREQRGDQEGGQQHDDRQGPAEVGGERVGVGKAARDLARELLGGEDLGARAAPCGWRRPRRSRRRTWPP